MYLIAFVIIGLVASLVARWLGGKNPATTPRVSVVAAVVGALAGGVLGRMMGFHGNETELAGASLAVMGSVLVLTVVHVLARGRGSGSSETG